MRKERLNRLEVRARHCKNMRGAIDQRRRERLTAHCMDTGRNNFDVLTIANQTTKKPFRDRASTNITCADKEDAFHGSHGASERQSNLEANGSKSIQAALAVLAHAWAVACAVLSATFLEF